MRSIFICCSGSSSIKPESVRGDTFAIYVHPFNIRMNSEAVHADGFGIKMRCIAAVRLISSGG